MINVRSNVFDIVPTKFAARQAKDPCQQPTTPQLAHTLPFRGNYNTSFRTTLSGQEETTKYNTLTQMLDKKEKKTLELALKSGVLLNNASNDKSTVLDNLYNIATKPRAEGLNNKTILTDTINSVTNPYTITQKFGDIPKEYRQEVISELTGNSQNLIERKKAENQLDNLYSGCCVAASEQFSLATKQPAEYVRMVEGISSPSKAVEKKIKLSSLSQNTGDAIWLLNAFEIPYTATNYETATLKLAPDKNAYTRAKIQQDYRDPLERSSVDVLMQSTFMNVGSQQTYNSLNDKRAGKFSSDDSGLIDYEKTFLETIVEDKNITSVTYQNIDENQVLQGYTADFDTIKNQLLKTIDKGHNIIIGYTVTNHKNEIVGAHEITITDYKKDNKGQLMFICNDTDDDVSEPVVYPASYLIPKIHHAGIPEDIANEDLKQIETWRYNLNEMNKK